MFFQGLRSWNKESIQDLYYCKHQLSGVIWQWSSSTFPFHVSKVTAIFVASNKLSHTKVMIKTIKNSKDIKQGI
jgi:glutamate mutase epsilon subunit